MPPTPISPDPLFHVRSQPRRQAASAPLLPLGLAADPAPRPCAAASPRAHNLTVHDVWFQRIRTSPAADARCTAAALLHSPTSRAAAPVLITSMLLASSCTPGWHKRHSSG